jgi:vitamin B12 transporter
MMNKVSANLTFFRDQGKNAIDWVWLNDRSLYKAMNIAEVTTRGIEITCKYQPPNSNKRSFRVNNTGVSYTLIDLEKATGAYESKYSLDYLKHKLLFYFMQGISKKVNLNCQVSYVVRNGSYIDYDNTTMTRFNFPFKPYWLADSKLSWSSPYFVFFAEVSNIFNTKYTDVGNLIQPGRWITGGIQINFSFEKE